MLEYGPAAVYSASVTWNPERSAFNMAFGSSSSATGVNPHCLMRTQLEIQLNKERNLALLGKILTETWCPVKSLSRLPTTPHKWMSTNSQQRNTAIQVLIQFPCTFFNLSVFPSRHSLSCHSRRRMSRSSSTTFTVLTSTFALKALCPFAMGLSQCLTRQRSSQTWNPSGVSRLFCTNMLTRLHWRDEPRRRRMITLHPL